MPKKKNKRKSDDIENNQDDHEQSGLGKKKAKTTQKAPKKRKDIAPKEEELTKREKLLAQKEQEIAQREKLVVQKEQEIAQREKLLVQKEQEIAQRELVVEKTEENYRLKKPIKEALSKLFGVELDSHILVYIEFGDQTSDVSVVGRGKISGTTSQMRHVIPHTTVKEIIKVSASSSKSPAELVKILRKSLLLFVNLGGYAIAQNDLASSEYTDVAQKFSQLASSSITTPSKNSYDLLMEEQTDQLKLTPHRAGKAKDLFADKYPKFVLNVIKQFSDLINVNNNDYICELLSRFMFILFTKSKYQVAYPDEGNTINFEYRLYKDKADCAKAVEYSVINPLMLSAAKNLQEYNDRIRVVKNEGALIIKIKKQLDVIHSALGLGVKASKDLEFSNLEKNILLLANVDPEEEEGFFKKFNILLKSKPWKKFLEKWPTYVAVKIWQLFDLKALEDRVFVAAPKDSDAEHIRVLVGASGAKEGCFKLRDGAEYRQELIASCISKKKYGKKIEFRPQELAEDNVKTLADYALLHLSIISLAFPNFLENDKPNSLLEEAFLEIIKKDYQLNEGGKNTNFLKCFDDELERYKATHYPYNYQDEYEHADISVELSGKTVKQHLEFSDDLS